MQRNTAIKLLLGTLVITVIGVVYIRIQFMNPKRQQSENTAVSSPLVESTPEPSSTPKPAAKTPLQQADPGPWGVAKQIDETTWTMKVTPDNNMATAGELLMALNVYRSSKGVGQLSWDDRLAEYARTRAQDFVRLQNTDKHAGFNEFVANPDNFKSLGVLSVGENSSFGYRLNAVHIIEWIYAGDASHDNNQLDSKWTHVGIAVSETATEFIFGKK